MREGFKFICITGPTKSGKTVLCRKVLAGEATCWVHGGQIETDSEFWEQIAGSLDLCIPNSKLETKSKNIGVSSVFSGNLEAATSHNFETPASIKRSVLDSLKRGDICLVIDDFHYISADIQKNIIRALKSEIFDGLRAILIAVPHRAFDAISVEREMEGRFAHIEIPSWRHDELIKIADLGFNALKIQIDDGTIIDFSQESFGSPLLMQRFCHRCCMLLHIEEELEDYQSLRFSSTGRQKIYSEVSDQFGFPTFEKLAKGPQSRSKRVDRKFRNKEGSADIYEAILIAVANTGPKEKIHYNEIRDKLKDLLSDEAVPQKHEVSGALNHMSVIARDVLKGEPVIEWAEDFLYITDPFLMFFMKWSKKIND